MQFKPKTEKEIATDGLLEKGEYDAEVMSAIEGVSKKGNPMMTVKMRVFRPNGGEAHIFDYLLETVAYKLRHFAFAIGLGSQYEAGALDAEDCVRRSCVVVVGIDDKNKDFPPKNVIKDYVVEEEEKASSEQAPARSIPKSDSETGLEVEEDDILW